MQHQDNFKSNENNEQNSKEKSLDHDSLFDFKELNSSNKNDHQIPQRDQLNNILNSMDHFSNKTNHALEENVESEILFDETNIKNNDKQVIEYDLNKIKSVIESALYICGNDGLSLIDLKQITELPSNIIKKIMKEWTDQLEKDASRGLSIKIFGDKYKFFSKPSNRESMSKLITIKYRNPLSSKLVETLAIIAYNQPCTKTIIHDIRAKDPTTSIERLIDLGLVIEIGRADSPGRPSLFTVTHKFYDIFGIKNLNDLPTINLIQPFQDEDISFFDTNRFDE